MGSAPSRFATVGLLFVLAACSGAPQPAARTSTNAPPTIVSSARAKAGGTPSVRMQAGTDSVTGKLERYCEGKRCARESAAPKRSLELVENRLLLFVISSAPSSARVEVRRASSGRLVDRRALAPDEVMPFVAKPRPGRYLVTLVASWKRAQGRWLFALRVPEELD